MSPESFLGWIWPEGSPGRFRNKPTMRIGEAAWYQMVIETALAAFQAAGVRPTTQAGGVILAHAAQDGWQAADIVHYIEGLRAERRPDRLVRDGLVLRFSPNGPIWFGLGVTAFPLLQRWIEGGPPAITPYLDWMQRAGVEIARALGMYAGGIGRFLPDDYGSRYFLGLDSLATWLAGRGQWLKLSVFADAPTTLAPERHRRFFEAVAEVCAPHANVLLDGGNEWQKNGWRPADLSRPAAATFLGLCSRGSSIGDESPPADPWDFADVHPARDAEWMRKFKQLYDERVGATPSGRRIEVPIGVDETIGVGEEAEASRTTNDPEACFDFTAGVKLLGDFVIWHLRSGIRLEPPGPKAEACLAAAVAATRLIPAGWKLARYTRGGPAAPFPSPLIHDDRLALRTIVMVDGPQALGVVVQPRGTWRAQAAPGWRITQLAGGRENVIWLERTS